MLCRICVVQIKCRKHVSATADHADYTAPTRKHDELDHTDQENLYLPCQTDLDNTIDDLADDL